MTYQWKIFFLTLFLGLSHQSWGAETKGYQTFVGNHQYVELKVSKDTLNLDVSYMNNTSDHLQYRRIDKSFLVNQGSHTQVVTHEAAREDYVRLALRLRDFVAMLTSPYPFGEGNTSSLHPELNDIIGELDQITSLGDQALANCILYPANGILNPFVVSAGIHGSLGAYQDNVSRIWVRKGYELVLLDSPEFHAQVDQSVIAKGNGQSTGKGLSVLESQSLPSNLLDTDPASTKVGAHFALSRTAFENRVGSILCRPDIQ